jgi:hypothetical protein
MRSSQSLFSSQLKYDINERARARDLIDHAWLDNILVPAELDELHRMAQEAADREDAGEETS